MKTVDVTLQGKDNTKSAFDSATKNAETFGAELKEKLNAPFDFLKSLIAVEMVRLFAEFTKSTVEAAAESEASWARVGQAVENAGISFGGVRDELKETFEAISDKTRFSEQQVSDAFATVLNVTNDYTGSVKNLGLITDLAVAKQIDLNTAATIVGKAMDGQTSLLKRYGIVIKDGADAMDELNKRFSGFAERDGASLQGRLHQIANEWEEFKIQIGEAITGTDTAANSAGKLVSTLSDMATWVEKNREVISGLTNAVLSLAGALGSVVVGAGKSIVAVGEGLGIAAGEAYNRLHGVSNDDSGDEGDAAYYNALDKIRQRRHAQSETQIAANQRQAAADKAQRDAEAADKALTKRIADLQKEADVLLKSRDITNLTAADEAKLGQYAYDLLTTSKDTTLSLRERTAAAEQLQRISDANKKIGEDMLKNEKELRELEMKGVSIAALRAKPASALLADRTDLAHDPFFANAATRSANAPNVSFVNGPTAAALPTTAGSSFGREVGFNIKALFGGDEAFKDVDESLGSLTDHLESLTSGGVRGLFDAWQAGIDAVIQGHEKMGVVIPRIMRQAVGASLAADAQDTLLRAAKALALGLTDPSGIHFAQAGKLFAIGTAELAAAAALSGGGGGAGAGGGGGGVSAAGFQQTQSQIGGGGKVTVYFPGKKAVIDATDPDDLNALRDAIQSLVGTRDLEFVFGSGG